MIFQDTPMFGIWLGVFLMIVPRVQEKTIDASPVPKENVGTVQSDFFHIDYVGG